MVEGGRLVLRAGAVIALTVAAAVVFAVALAFFKFDQKLLDVTVNRLSVVAQEVRRQAEVGLALGLDLSELVDLKGVVTRAAAAGDVTRVDLADVGGKVRFSSDPDGEGRRAPAAAGIADSAGAEGMRRVIEGDAAVLIAPLRNGFGEPAGAVLVEVSVEPQRRQVAAVRAELISAAAPVIAVALAVTLAAVMLTVRWSVETGRREGEDGSSADGERRENAESLYMKLDAQLQEAIAEGETALETTARRLGAQLEESRR